MWVHCGLLLVIKWSLERRKISSLYAAVILVPDSILLQEVK